MNLEIADDDARELKVALDIHLVEMRGELTHTDDHAYRADLRSSIERLERVAAKLAESLGPAGGKRAA
jgi:hypothetical protein